MKIRRSSVLIMSLATSYLHFGVVFFANLALIPVMLHFLGSLRYGLWVTILSVIGYIGIMDMGSSFTVGKYFAEADGADQNQKMSRFLSTAIVMYSLLGLASLVVIIGLSYCVATGFSLQGLASEATITFLIAGLNLAVSFPLNVFNGLLFGKKQVVAYNMFNALGVIFGFVAIYLGLVLGYGLIGMATALMVSNILMSVCRIYFVKKKFSGVTFNLRLVEPKLFRQLLAFGSMMFVLGVGGQIIFNTDNLVIAKFLGVGMVAVYAIAFRVNQVVISFINKLADTFFPFYTELYVQEDYEKLRLYLFESSQFSSLISFFMFITMIFWGEPIMILWLGKENFIGQPVFFLLALIVLMSSLIHLPAVMLQGMGKIRGVVGFNLAEAAINIGLSIILVIHYGVLGVALGTVLAMALTSLWYVPYRICLETKSSFRQYIQTIIMVPLCLAGLTILSIIPLEFFIKNTNLFLLMFKLALVGFLYFGLFICFGLNQERKSFYFHHFLSFWDNLSKGKLRVIS